MCRFCTQHGEGKKWYLTVENYSWELARELGTEPYADHFARHFEGHGVSIARIDRLRSRLPRLYELGRPWLDRRQEQVHFGQVVPLEDLEQVLDLQESIVRLPCVCRRMSTGREVRYCLGFGHGMAGVLGRYPDHSDGLEVMTREEAKAYVRELDDQGLVHSVWTFKTPYIGAVCNCDRDCLAYQLQVESDLLTMFFPAEFVAAIDADRCTGCRSCTSRCQFGALRWSAATRLVQVDSEKCYGCGVCRAACDHEAIELRERVWADDERGGVDDRAHRNRPVGAQVSGGYRPSSRGGRTAAASGGHRVIVDADRCRSAQDCLRCVDACAQRVFGLFPLENRRPGVRPSEWRMRPVFEGRCDGCGECVRACEREAISVA